MSKIYGWSWKSWDAQYMVAFDSEEEANEWLHTEEYDFRERELLTRDEARAQMGPDVFDEWDETDPIRF